jgi:hypothetical protein
MEQMILANAGVLAGFCIFAQVCKHGRVSRHKMML